MPPRVKTTKRRLRHRVSSALCVYTEIPSTLVVRVKQSVCPDDNFKLYDLLPRYLARSDLKVMVITQEFQLSSRMKILQLLVTHFLVICRVLATKVVGATSSECFLVHTFIGWLGSQVVSVLNSGTEGPGFKSQSRRYRVTVLGKLFTPNVPLFTKQQNW